MEILLVNLQEKQAEVAIIILGQASERTLCERRENNEYLKSQCKRAQVFLRKRLEKSVAAA